jgi:hypothetical protein
MTSSTFSLLDLRLMLRRQPLMAMLFGGILALAGWLLTHQSEIQPVRRWITRLIQPASLRLSAIFKAC